MINVVPEKSGWKKEKKKRLESLQRFLGAHKFPHAECNFTTFTLLWQIQMGMHLGLLQKCGGGKTTFLGQKLLCLKKGSLDPTPQIKVEMCFLLKQMAMKTACNNETPAFKYRS